MRSCLICTFRLSAFSARHGRLFICKQILPTGHPAGRPIATRTSYHHLDVLSPPGRPITTWTYDKRVIAADINYELPGKIKRVYFQYMACAALKFFGFAPIIM